MEQQFDQPFEQLGLEPVEGAELMSLLRVTPQDLAFPDKFMKVRDIAAYLHGHPDMGYFVHKITAGKSVDALDHVWGYVKLRREHDDLSKRVDKLKSELSFYE